MSESKHTPGEWIAREGTTTGMEVVGKKARGGDYVVARCGGKDREGNARLIAAAPDLMEEGREFLDAAEAVFDWMNGNDLSADHAEQMPEDFARISAALVSFRAAIAKAEGRS